MQIPESVIYKVRYGLLRSTMIFNECGPYSGGPEGWDDESVQRRQEVGDRYIENLNLKRNFYINLERSILEQGYRNPILVNAGWCPKIRDRGRNGRLPLEMQKDHKTILTCNTNGGSRLWVAQKYNMNIPCVIADYVDRFIELPILGTKEEVMACYQDRPENIVFKKDEMRIIRLPQVS